MRTSVQAEPSVAILGEVVDHLHRSGVILHPAYVSEMTESMRQADEILAKLAAEDQRVAEILTTKDVEMVTAAELATLPQQHLAVLFRVLCFALAGALFDRHHGDVLEARLSAEQIARKSVEDVKRWLG